MVQVKSVHRPHYISLDGANHRISRRKLQYPLKMLCVNDRLPYINFGLLSTMKKNRYNIKMLPLANYSARKQKLLLDSTLRSFKPDFIFTPGWSIWMFDTEQFLQIISQYDIPHIYWATEDPVFFDLVSSVFAPYSDYVFTPAAECKEKYQRMGIPSSTLMFGYNPSIFRKVRPKSKYQHDIVVVANNYNWSGYENIRSQAIENLIEPLIRRKYDIKIWGKDWTNPKFDYTIDKKYYGGTVNYLETPHIYASAKIVIGLQNVDNSPTQTSCRTFEVLGSNAFYLTNYTLSHENLFTDRRHLALSKSPGETLRLVDYYLKNSAARKAVALRGQREVQSKHTYIHRLRQLEDFILPILKK